MELREWKYMNPPQVAGTSGQITSGGSSGYKKRFEKLIKYHIDHASSELESITRKDIGNGYFRLSEHWYHAARPDGYDRDITVHYNQSTDTFSISIYIDHNEVEDTKEIGYENFLKFLKNYIWLPKIGSAEYNDLLTESLTEWQLMNSPTQQTQAPASSTKGGYWERFNRLLYYHVKHKSPSVDRIVRTQVRKDGFHYTEHHRAGTSGYEKDIVVNIDLAATENWKLQTYINGKPHVGGAGDGYTNLLKELRKYLTLPTVGTPEYKELLTESFSSELKEWKAMNSTSTSKPANSPSQKERYKKLITQIDADKISTYTVNELTDTILDFNVSTKYKPAGYRVKIEYSPATDDFILQVGDGTAIKGNDWNEDILTLFGAGAILRETDILRESYSIADDFKLYENLWDDEGKRFKVIMVVDDEEYTYGTYDSRDRANEVAMEVRDARGVDTYIEEV